MNETVLNETDLLPRQWYDHEDRNMSDWVMSLWCNFSHYRYAATYFSFFLKRMQALLDYIKHSFNNDHSHH